MGHAKKTAGLRPAPGDRRAMAEGRFRQVLANKSRLGPLCSRTTDDRGHEIATFVSLT